MKKTTELLKQRFKVRKSKELARLLGISAQVMSNFNNRLYSDDVIDRIRVLANKRGIEVEDILIDEIVNNTQEIHENEKPALSFEKDGKLNLITPETIRDYAILAQERANTYKEILDKNLVEQSNRFEKLQQTLDHLVELTTRQKGFPRANTAIRNNKKPDAAGAPQ